MALSGPRGAPALFSDGRRFEVTSRVARYVDVRESDARAWARDNGVERLAKAYLWSEDDVAAFLTYLEADARARLAEARALAR